MLHPTKTIALRRLTLLTIVYLLGMIATNYLMGVLWSTDPDTSIGVYQLSWLLGGGLVCALYIRYTEQLLVLDKYGRYALLLFLGSLLLLWGDGGWGEQALLLGLLLVYYAVCSAYLNPHQPISYLVAGLMVGMGCLWYPAVLWSVPLLLWCMYVLRAFSLRHILAMFIGLLLPLWVGIPIIYYMRGAEIYPWIISLGQAVIEIQWIEAGLSKEMLILGILSGLWLFGCIAFLISFYQEVTRRRAMIGLHIFSGFYFLLLSLLHWSVGNIFLLFSIPSIAILLSQVATYFTDRAHKIYLAVLLILFMVSMVAIHWIPYIGSH